MPKSLPLNERLDTPFTLNLSREMYEKLTHSAKKLNVTRGDVAREALLQWLAAATLTAFLVLCVGQGGCSGESVPDPRPVPANDGGAPALQIRSNDAGSNLTGGGLSCESC